MIRGETVATYMAKPSDVKKEWLLIDATGVPLGRLASHVAQLLRGKHKPIFTPHIDTGDFVIVINAEKVKLTGRKLVTETRFRHTGYPGGAKEVSLAKLMEKRPEEVVRKAVWGMLPHNRLGRATLRKLKAYRGSNHPHEAQNPKARVLEEGTR